ncbi:MAG: hypothetical protein K2P01_07145 [Oscillospiraceae bacterium]|nr:hypothetical protein [Oscillospiraceae bacterium]
MEFLMEFLIEFVGILADLVLEGGADAASNCRRPMWQRVLILALLALIVLVFAAVFALMTASGVMMLTEGRPIAGVLMLGLALGLVVLSLHKLRKILRTFSRK